MINFIFSPILSLFSLSFYREVMKSSVGKGFLYILYLSLIFAAATDVIFARILMPQADRFAEWFRDSFPPMTFTKEGVVTDVAQPFKLEHPTIGSLMMIDTSKETATIEEIRSTLLYVTKKSLYVWDGRRNQYRIFELAPMNAEAEANWKDLEVTGEKAYGIYLRFAPMAYPIVFLLCFVFFFIWKLLAGVFYSLIALIINTFRKNRLNYEKLLNVAFFSLTPATYLQWASSLFPGRFRLNFLWTLAVTTLFLAYVLIGTDSQEEDEMPLDTEAQAPSV